MFERAKFETVIRYGSTLTYKTPPKQLIKVFRNEFVLRSQPQATNKRRRSAFYT